MIVDSDGLEDGKYREDRPYFINGQDRALRSERVLLGLAAGAGHDHWIAPDDGRGQAWWPYWPHGSI